MKLIALLLAVLGLSAGGDEGPPRESQGPPGESQGPPGSWTWGKQFCEFAEVPLAGDRKVRLTVERPVVHLGGTAFGRVENRGSPIAGFGVEYNVQRHVGGAWRDVPGGGVHGGPQIALGLGPGDAGYCMRHHLPEDAPTGLYRFTREISGRTYVVRFRVAP